jgi:hypothetical protein
VHCAAPAAAPRQLSHSSAGAYEAALTATPSGFVASWYDIRDGNGEIYIRATDVNGQPGGQEIRLTRSAAESYEPSVAAYPDGRIAVGWYDKSSSGAFTAYVGVWTTGGATIWTTALPGAGRNPVLTVDRERIVVAWIRSAAIGDGEEVWAAVLNETGDVVGEPGRLGLAHRTTWNVNLVLDERGAAWVVWDAVWDTRASELFVARVTPGSLPPEGGSHIGISVTRLTSDDGQDSKYPDVAVHGDNAAVTWFDAKGGNTEVYLFAGAAGQFTSAIEGRAQRVTETRGESIGAYLAANGPRLGLAWSDDTVGQHEVYFQAFDWAGRALTAAQRVTDNSMSSLVPAIEPWRNGFALAWNEFVPGEPGGHGGRSEIAFALMP